MLHHTKHSAFEKQENQMVVKYLTQENPSWESRVFPEAQECLLFFKKRNEDCMDNESYGFTPAGRRMLSQKASQVQLTSPLARGFGSPARGGIGGLRSGMGRGGGVGRPAWCGDRNSGARGEQLVPRGRGTTSGVRRSPRGRRQ